MPRGSYSPVKSQKLVRLECTTKMDITDWVLVVSIYICMELSHFSFTDYCRWAEDHEWTGNKKLLWLTKQLNAQLNF